MTFPAHLRSGWYVACLARELGRRPRACTVLDHHLVLFRDGAGRPVALIDRCPHRNAPLSAGRVSGGNLVCPYHGWEFDGAGQCRVIPGSLPAAVGPRPSVPAFRVAEDGPLLWVAATPGMSPEVELPRHHRVGNGNGTTLVDTFAVEAPLLDAVENVLDATHTHFVHTGLVRGGRARKIVRAAVRRGADRVEAEYRGEGRPSGLIGRLFGGGITHSTGRFLLPATAQLDYCAGGRVALRITLYFTPGVGDRQQVCAVVTGAVPPWLGRPLAGPLAWLLRRAMRQDQRILALQAANVRRFGGTAYASTDLDLMRPHLTHLWRHGPAADNVLPEREVTVLL